MRLVDKYLIFIILQQLNYIESFLKQSDLLTIILKNELRTFKFKRDNFNYKLIQDQKVILFDLKFLQIIDEIDTKTNFTVLYDSYEQEKNKPISVFEKDSKFAISFYQKDKKLTKNLENGRLIIDPQIKFRNENDEFSCFIYYTLKNDTLNRTVYYLNLNNNNFSVAKFNWRRDKYINTDTKTNNANKVNRIFVHTNSDYYMLYDEEEKVLNLQLPFLGYFKAVKDSNAYQIKTLVQFPLLCSENYDFDYLKQNLYKNLVDAYADSNQLGIAFYFIFRSIDHVIISVLKEKTIQNIIQYDSSDELDCQFNNKKIQFNSLCTLKPKFIPQVPILLKFDKQTFKRILVKTIVGKNSTITRILFLLDDLNRLHIYDITEENKICYEGVYSLINQKTDDILDISLDKKEDMILVVTKNYLQKIPIKSFCISSSYSACIESQSTCHIGKTVSPVCKDSQFKNRKCLEYDSNLRIRSELFLCDRNSKDMCLVGDFENLTSDLKQDLILCDEESCLCKYQHCLQKSCNFDSSEKHFCPLPKSAMKLSKYSVIYQIEPFHIIIFSKLITLVIITFILVSFYCCFSTSISQSSKKVIADLSVNSDLKTI